MIEESKNNDNSKSDSETKQRDGLYKNLIIRARQYFDVKFGNNANASLNAQTMMADFQDSIPGVGVDMYITIIATDSVENDYINGGEIDVYKSNLTSVFLMVIINDIYWNSITDTDKKDLVAYFVKYLENEYPNKPVRVEINNGARTVADGKTSLFGDDPKIELQ